jgi:hypothetical protein
VVLSLARAGAGAENLREKAAGTMIGNRLPTRDCIRLMGWVELSKGEQGVTDWCLFRRVMREIEGMERNAPAMCLKKMVLHVNTHGNTTSAGSKRDFDFQI